MNGDRKQISGSLGVRRRGEQYLLFVGYLVCAGNCSTCYIHNHNPMLVPSTISIIKLG